MALRKRIRQKPVINAKSFSTITKSHFSKNTIVYVIIRNLSRDVSSEYISKCFFENNSEYFY